MQSMYSECYSCNLNHILEKAEQEFALKKYWAENAEQNLVRKKHSAESFLKSAYEAKANVDKYHKLVKEEGMLLKEIKKEGKKIPKELKKENKKILKEIKTFDHRYRIEYAKLQERSIDMWKSHVDYLEKKAAYLWEAAKRKREQVPRATALAQKSREEADKVNTRLQRIKESHAQKKRVAAEQAIKAGATTKAQKLCKLCIINAAAKPRMQLSDDLFTKTMQDTVCETKCNAYVAKNGQKRKAQDTAKHTIKVGAMSRAQKLRRMANGASKAYDTIR